MAERRLTLSRLYRSKPRRAWRASSYTPEPSVPYPRIRGKWLEELGFEAGAKVAVIASPGRLVITPAAVSEMAEPAAGEN
ncbi:MAG: type I addiction module toxin, SymE family [Alphaproteobacteria bacterium]|nr:MAG: type I addiction module toxin, SymE family [Alphaproteobacteria bacterium]